MRTTNDIRDFRHRASRKSCDFFSCCCRIDVNVFVVMMRIAARAIERSAVTARQKFLVIHLTDPAGAVGGPDADRAHSTVHIGRMHVIPASGD